MKTRTSPFLLAGLVVASVPAVAQTDLLNETFSDADRSNQALPNSAAWYLLNDTAATPTATVNSEGELAWTEKSGTYSALISFFTPENQPHALEIGDSLKLEFRAAFDNLSEVTRVVRIALFNSGGRRLTEDVLHTGSPGQIAGTTFNDWRGYSLYTAVGAFPVPDLLQVFERSSANQALFSSGAYTQLGSLGETGTFIEVEFAPFELTITRRAAEIEINGGAGDAVIGPISDSSALITSFDAVALFVQPQISGLRIDDLKVTHIPNPAPDDDPNLTILTETVFGRLPLDAPSPTAEVEIKNTGATQTLTIQPQSAVTGPDSAHYTILTPLPVSIAPGATGVVEVAFNPQDRSGDFVATLELRSNDPSQPVLPLTLDTRYFQTGAQLLSNSGFEAADGLLDWLHNDIPLIVAGFGAGSTNAALLSPGAILGRTNLVVPGDFQLDFEFAVQDTPDQGFEFLFKTFPGFDRINAFFDLRYNAGQFNTLSGGTWSGDLGLGTLEPSIDTNFDGDLDDPEDTANIYRLRLTGRGWGGESPAYDLALTGPDSSEFTRQATGLTNFIGGGGGGAAPPIIVLFSAENNPGYWLDNVQFIAGLPAGGSTFSITQIDFDEIGRDRITITWESQAGATYALESVATPGSQWETIVPSIPATGTSTSYATAPRTASMRFYRVPPN